MKVFRVWVDDFDYDMYDEMIVVAESKEAVLRMGNHEDGRFAGWRFGDEIFFYDFQGGLHIEEVDLNKEQILLASFHAG